MCDQTEISYLDGDIVWVKLGSAWWPGQVTGLDNLPDVLQAQYKKKPHIAAVKFFQEDSYELVRNIQQIYKYNCRQKDDFIKKGLDKYRSRSKDGTNYMDKFPGDVETAEKLTDGDPDILSSSKFCEQKKPDISSLFGEKKLPKRKKDKDDTINNRKSLIGSNDTRKITHPRFIGRKSDHEIRIRQQNTKNFNPSTPTLNDSSSAITPTATPTRTTPSTPSIYTCPHCDYTSTRLNVIICHNKSHRNNVTRPSITPVRRPIPQKSRTVSASIGAVNDGEIQKRKYTRKNKSLSVKLKDDKIIDTPKRKYNKGIEKPPKKKKNDPEIKEEHIRESLLADWEDGSEDGDMDIDLDNSASEDFPSSPSKNINKEKINNDKDIDDVDKSLSPIKNSTNLIDTDVEVEKQQQPPQQQQRSPLLKKFKKLDDSKTNLSSSDDKNDQKSKLSCFDFDEDEEPQPALPPARKITRVFGEKNKSRKKELIKEFTRTSQAFANEKVDEEEQGDLSQKQSKEEIKKSDNDDKIKDIVDDDNDDDDFNDKINREINETTELVAKIAETTTDLIPSKSEIIETIETIEILKVNEDQEDIEEEKEVIEQNDEKLDKVQEENKNDTNKIDEKFEDDKIHDDGDDMMEDVKEKNDVEDIEETKNDIEMKKVEEKEEQVDQMVEEKEKQVDKIDEEKEELDDKMNEEKMEQDDKIDEVMQEQVDKIDEEKEELVDKMNEEKEEPVDKINEEKEELDDKINEEKIEQDYKIDEVMQEDIVEKNEKIDKPVIDADQVLEMNNENKNTDVELTKEKENQDIEADKEEKTQDIEFDKEEIDKIDQEEKIQEIETTDQEKSEQIEDDLENNKLNLTESAIVSESEINKVQEISDLKINETDEMLQSDSEKEIINSPNELIESAQIIIEPETIKEINDEKMEDIEAKIEDIEEKVEQVDQSIEKIDEEMKTDDEKIDTIEESRITIEAEEEMLSISELTAATTSGTSSNIDKTFSQVNKINTPTKIEFIDNKTITPDVPEKRRRGRPRKTPIPSYMSGNGDSLIKIDEPKTPGTPDSQDFDRKTSESDGEKSNAGRRRKPSKKYLESDMYCPSPGSRTPRTDDSQSEAEDKSLTIKKRGKRGRKPSKKSIAKSIEEYEFSDQTLDSAEESMIGEPIKIQDINKKTDTLSPVDLTDLLVNSDIEIRDNKSHDDNNDDDDNKIDKLPPKKSQIKKFESSQYEFFGSDDKEESTKIIETITTATTTTHTDILSDNNVNEILVESKIEAPQKEEHSMEIQMETNEISDVNETVIEETIENIIVENDKKMITEEKEEVVNVVEPIKSLIENVEVSEDNKSMIVDTNMSIDEEKEKIADEVVVQDNVVIVEEHVETIEEVVTLPEVTTETVVEEKIEEVALSNEEVIEEVSVVEEKIEEISLSNEEVIETTEVVEKIEETTEIVEQKLQENEEIPVQVENVEQIVENIEKIPENIEPIVEKVEEMAVRIEEIPVKVEEKMVQLLEQVEAMDNQTEEIVTTMPDNETTETITTEIIETTEIPLPIIQETPKIQEIIVSSPKKVEPIVNKITTINQNIIETPQQKSQELIMPVKKREKPRIIENVTLKQPMQILKTKLLEKPRSQKHKLDIDMLKRNKSTPPTKIMRIDPQLIKTKTSGKIGTGQLTISKKLEVLKADEAKNEAINEEVLGNTSGVISLATSGSQGFQNMELDIDSIPFIFQEDLNPDSIKQLPDMTSTIITPSPTIQTSIQQPQQTSALTFVQTTQPTVTQQIQLAQKTPDNSGELSPSKKKNLSPAILKNKPKAKPTITSVKTLMPGSLKQLKFGQNAQGKTVPLINQKGGVPSKYIILHTSNAQQMPSNKTSTPQKIPIPQNKTPNQIIQQGNKVVILTSPQSGQTKMLPLSMQKNVQQKKIIKGNQVYTQISKNQILPKTDTSSSSSSSTASSSSSSSSSPTTSKIITGQKIISTAQGNIVTSKVFTSVPGMQKIYVQSDGTRLMAKGGQVYTTISTGGLTKMITGQKTLVTKQGTIVGTVAGQSGSKTILSPVTQGNKQIITHNLQSSKGTVLTPITGQQVKAIAAKALPSKTQKMQFIQQQQQQQQQQQKSPIISKTQKLPMTSGTNMAGVRVVTTNRNIKNAGQQVIIQNSPVLNQQSPLTKATAVGKKIIRQNIVNQSGKSPQLLSSSSPSGTSLQMTKTKLLSSPATTIQKSANTPKGRPLKSLQNKVFIQKIQDPSSSPSTKPNVSSTITKVTGSPKMTNLKTTPVVKNIQKSLISSKQQQPQQQQQQQLRNISAPMASSSSHLHTIQSSPPPLQEIKKSDIEETIKVVTTASPIATTLSSQPPPLVSAVTATTALAITTTVATTTTTVSAVVAAEAAMTTTVATTAAIETNEVIVKQNTEVGVQSQTEVSTESNETSDEQKVATSQIIMFPAPSVDGSPSFSLYVVDENGIANPMDSTAIMALDGLSIDPNSSNFVIQFDDEAQIQALDASQTIQQQEQQPSATQIVSTNSNQDILAAALANSDFQGEISMPETSSTSVLSTDINQTNLISQTILQSTLVPPPAEKLSSNVHETSLTWDRPIMTPLELPTLTQNTTTNLSSSVPFNINYMTDVDNTTLPGNSMPDIGETVDSHKTNDDEDVYTKSTAALTTATTQYLDLSNLETNETIVTTVSTSIPSTSSISYSVSIPDNITSGVQTTPSMPIIDDIFSDNIEFNKKTIDNKFSSKNKNNNKTNKNNKNKKLDKNNKQVTTDVPIDNNVLLLKNNDDKLINQQPETSQKILDMPIVGDTPIIDNKIEDKNNDDDDNKNLLNSDVVDSCMTAVVDNSCIITESSNDVQSTAKIIDNNNQDNDVKNDVLTTTNNQEEAETSDKKVVICDNIESMEVDEIVYNAVEEIKQTAESSNVQEIEAMECTFNEDTVDAEQNQEIPSQSFEQFKIIDNNESPSQSVEKSTDSREPSQSEADELMEINNEPPSQSFENSALHEASQSYQENSNINSRSDQIDDPSFPTQSYDVGKIDNITENIETDCELSQEGNIPSQSNDVDIDGIGTSTFTNQGNDDETASSSYVPETPEAQERDQDQESAISTSSYEIPPSDEINIASSSLIPDTSGNEHANIHDNGVPEIPTSSYNLNPDSSSTHIDSQVPSSSFEDQIVIEQNVSTSYDIPISMPSIEDNSSSGNFVSESGDQTNEPTSYYARNPEDVTSEASQSYFVRDAPSPSYNEQNVSPSYYDAPQEASQSFYSTQEIERTAEQSSSSSSSRNVEASQSFYQDNSDELRLTQQQGEATPTYYPLDNDNEPIERHDLVESSVSATRPTER
ncbi:uncharacterized protein LOC122850458 [Aphidius gifuensis]|uniref:uncharacterized protein LOC122850458 n=1 Tax=Aphidius gifuensis TaxID=684658 RepID=UPI001CDBCA5C|nr:uncharacterized protein LOC122850458 [Aphidius gifuensis]